MKDEDEKYSTPYAITDAIAIRYVIKITKAIYQFCFVPSHAIAIKYAIRIEITMKDAISIRCAITIG